MAHALFNKWLITSSQGDYEVLEAEFLLHSMDDPTHRDPYIDCSPVQRYPAHWYLTSNGVDLTFGSEKYYAAIFLRSIRHVQTDETIMGPWRVFERLFQNGGDAISGCNKVALAAKANPTNHELHAIPRVSLAIEHDSPNLHERLQFIFKPYRFVRNDAEDFPEKYLAYLYLTEVEKKPLTVREDSKIYSKYKAYFEKGEACKDLERVWDVSSRMHRMAMLMGYLKRTGKIKVGQ